VPAAQPSSAGAEQAPAAKPADAAEKGSAGSGGQATVVVPDIGDATDVEVIEVMVAVGDRIELEQSLITVESDKASMEVPSSQVGTVKEVRVKLGDKVNQGDEIVVVELDASAQAPAAPAEVAPNGEVRGADDAPEAGEETSAPSAEATAAVVSGGPSQLASAPPERHSPTHAFASAEVPLRTLPHASPSVRKFARELGVDLTQVTGTGAKQ